MLTVGSSSLITATPLAGKKNTSARPEEIQDGFGPPRDSTPVCYARPRFDDCAAEVNTSMSPWRGALLATVLTLTAVGGFSGAAGAQTLPSPQDVKVSEQLQFLDRAGYLYQKDGLLSKQDATPEQALKQLKAGCSVYWNEIKDAPKQPINDIKQLDSFVEAVRQQSVR